MSNHELEALRREVRELCGRVDEHHEMLNGIKGEHGIAHKVNLLWRTFIWGVCALWGGIGVYISKLISKLNP